MGGGGGSFGGGEGDGAVIGLWDRCRYIMNGVVMGRLVLVLNPELGDGVLVFLHEEMREREGKLEGASGPRSYHCISSYIP